MITVNVDVCDPDKSQREVSELDTAFCDGSAAMHDRKYRHAIRCFSKAVELAKENLDVENEGDAQRLLGDACVRTNDTEQALEALKRALSLANESEDWERVGWVCVSLAEASMKAGYLHEAKTYIDQVSSTAGNVAAAAEQEAWGAEELAEGLAAGAEGTTPGQDSKQGESPTRSRPSAADSLRMELANLLALYHAHQGEVHRAEAVRLQRADQQEPSIAQLHLAQGEFEAAIAQCLGLQKLAEACGGPNWRARALMQAGLLYQQMGSADHTMSKCSAHLVEALEAARETGNRPVEMLVLAHLANLYEHWRSSPHNQRSAAHFRAQLYFLLSQRYARPVPQHCALSGARLTVLKPTELRSRELETEVTVLPHCLCAFRTGALQRWMFAPPRNSVLSPLNRAAGMCPVCDQDAVSEEVRPAAGDALTDFSCITVSIRPNSLM